MCGYAVFTVCMGPSVRITTVWVNCKRAFNKQGGLILTHASQTNLAVGIECGSSVVQTERTK